MVTESYGNLTILSPEADLCSTLSIDKISFAFFMIAVAKLGNMCLAAVQAYDTATESIEALNTAELKFQDIINSPSLDAACKK